MVELVAKEIVRNLLIVFLLVLVMFLAWDQSRAETVDLTIPPGDYMLVPVEPYKVVTINSMPVDPPVNPPVEPTDPGEYTYLPPLWNHNSDFANYYQPAYDSPEDGWQMISDMCGPVGSWDHEIAMAEGDTLNAASLDGCIHVFGVPNADGSKPTVQVGATRAYKGILRTGGLFVENVKVKDIGVPNDKYFYVIRNVDFSDWIGHAMLSSNSAKHLYVEVLDSTFERGNSMHALYIDNVAFANIQRNTIQSPGSGHALRSVAQKALIKDNLICNIQCDGETILKNKNGNDIIGMAPVDIYVNGETVFDGNNVVYYRHNNSSALHAAAFRPRPAITTVDRVRDGDHYRPLIWGSPEYLAEKWDWQIVETLVKNMTIECHGVQPCDGWLVRSDYPRARSEVRQQLQNWWKENAFTDWGTLLEYAHPSWHDTLNLMTDDFKAAKIASAGKGMPHNMPLAVPQQWRNRTAIRFENVSGYTGELWRNPPYDKDWCQGMAGASECINVDFYGMPDIRLGGNPEPPDTAWQESIVPYIPKPGHIARIPGTALTDVLLPDDGSLACNYLNCYASHRLLNLWVGWSFDESAGIIRLIAPGGHGDLGANSVYEFDITALKWSRVFDYSQPAVPFPDLVDGDGDGYLDCVNPADGSNWGVHSYDGLVYVPPIEASLLILTRTYDPRPVNPGDPKCKWAGEGQGVSMRLWRDAGGYENTGSDPIGIYHKSAYDPTRDVVYYISAFPDQLNELDYRTGTSRVIANVQAGSGGSMIIDGNTLYWSALNKGLFKAEIDGAGNISSGPTKLLEFDRDAVAQGWDDRDGLAKFGDWLVGWDGRNKISRYNVMTGELQRFTANGDVIGDPGDVRQVYSKWASVPGLDGVFIGIADPDGFVIYKDIEG